MMHRTGGRKLSIADIILIAGTRIALGAGIGRLLSGRLNNDQRKAAGLALTLIGGLTTISKAVGVTGQKSAQEVKPAASTRLKMRNHSAIYLEVSEHSSPSKVSLEQRPEESR